MNNIFYIYAYLDSRKPGKYKYGNYKFNYEPIYIGKGKNGRFLYHLFEKESNNKLKFNKIQKIKNTSKRGVIIVKLFENLVEKDAFKLEIKLIESIGRIDLGTGPLTNLTNGGEGANGCIFSDARRKNISNSLIKGGNVQGSNNPQSRKVYQYDLNGNLINCYENCMEAAKDNNTAHSSLNECCNGKRKSAGGYIWRYKKS